MASLTFVPGTLDITTYQGDTLTIPLRFKDSLGAPLDLSGLTFLAHILDTVADDAQASPVSITCAIKDAANGEVLMELSSSISTTLTGNYMYDLQATDGVAVRTYLRGKINIEQEVTR